MFPPPLIPLTPCARTAHHAGQAHNSPISCLAFSPRGDRLATASDKGTVIRVFATPSGEKLFEFRRGLKTNAAISSMAFSIDADLLAVSSDKQTVHVFKLEAAAPAADPSAAGGDAAAAAAAESWGSYLASGLTSAASQLLPTSVTEMWTQARSFAHLSLPSAGHRSVVSIVKPGPKAGGGERGATAVADGEGDGDGPIIQIVTSEGWVRPPWHGPCAHAFPARTRALRAVHWCYP